MALQELCGSQTFSGSMWDIPTTLGLTQNHTSLLLREYSRNNSTDARSWGSMNSPLTFYVPVADYLTESPLEFGQMRPSVALSPTATAGPLPDSILTALSLSASLPLSSTPSVPLPFPLSHGTTTLGFLFQGGVIAAADTRSSCSGLVACPASQKILPVHSHLVGTTSGTSADCALWKRILSRELRLYQLRHGRRLSTGGAAKLLSHMLHPFKGTELCVAATLCGWDGGELEACSDHGPETGLEESRNMEETRNTEESVCKDRSPRDSISTPVAWRKSQCFLPGSRGRQCTAGGRQGFSGPSLYYVCSDGTRLQGELFSVGSGSPYAYSVLDGQVHWGMTVREAVSVAREAVYRATHRDAYSGNCVDLFHVTAQGWRRRPREELMEEYYREKKEREKERERRREGMEREKGIDCDHECAQN